MSFIHSMPSEDTFYKNPPGQVFFFLRGPQTAGQWPEVMNRQKMELSTSREVGGTP